MKDIQNDPLWRTMLFFVLLIIIVIIVVIVMFFCLKKYALFNPTHNCVWVPDHNYQFEDLYIIAGDKTHNNGNGYTYNEIQDIKNSKWLTLTSLQYINVWFFNKYTDNKVVLYFHGNNDNISHRKYAVDICDTLKLNLLLVDYRGYGKSLNTIPNTKLILEDAESAYWFLRTKYNPNDIIIWGESLGGISAIYTASKFKCNSLILLSTFYNLNISIDKLDCNQVFKQLLKIFAKDKFIKNHINIKLVECPIMIIHSEEDNILPFENSDLLYNAAKSCKYKERITIKGIHSKPIFEQSHIKQLIKFLNIDDPEIYNNIIFSKIINIINNI